MKAIRILLVVAAMLVCPMLRAGEDATDALKRKLAARLKVPPGFVVECVALPPLVEHPMMGGFDERGRLFLADAAGRNLKAADLLKEFPNRIRVLEPADGHGHFRIGRIFADRMSFPMGALWHRGALYTASPPSLWKLQDTKGDGVADKRTELVTRFGFTGNAADIHGPFLGPDGFLYWCDGRHGHEIQRPDGTLMKGKAARIFRCRPDGSDVEVVCGGGMDNPVEIAFTAAGEPLVTVDILHARPARNDALIFAIEGGNYPWHEVSHEFPRTGDLLPAVADLGWVAPSGLTRYRSETFGKDYRNNLFSAQFNRARIQRHVVERAGAAFRIKTEDFLTSADQDFHPTDVLEDADGSLLVVDTGGWFRIGCPTSQIARPEIKGAVYRIRRQDAPAVVDPRGAKIPWEKLDAVELTRLLDDDRFAVRDRAVDQLGRGGPLALAACRQLLATSTSHRACLQAVRALTRMPHPEARTALRPALKDRDLDVRLAAIHAAGLHRDKSAFRPLTDSLRDGNQAVRRQAATALGRLGMPEGAPHLLEALRLESDRFLEHALIFALIRLEVREPLRTALKGSSDAVRRGALIALDQMKDGGLQAEEVIPLLDGESPALRATALDVVTRRPNWGKALVAGLEKRLDFLGGRGLDAKGLEDRREAVRRLVVGLSKDPAVEELVARSLKGEGGPLLKLTLLEAIQRTHLAKLPAGWVAGLGANMQAKEVPVVRQAIGVVRDRNLKDFDGLLQKTALDPRTDPDVRIDAFAAAAERSPSVPSPLFDFLMGELVATEDTLRKWTIAAALGRSRLDLPQKLALAGKLDRVGPAELPHLLGAFEPGGDLKTGRTLVQVLLTAPGLAGVSPLALERALAKFPQEIRGETKALTDRLREVQGGDAERQQARLQELMPLLDGGDVKQGRDLFYGARASCSACHAVKGQGGAIGPDLGQIGAIRSRRDLLEAVVFPSVSFARGYEPWVAETRSGKLITGLLARNTPDAVTLTTTDRQEVRIPRADLERLLPARTSVMPQGLDQQLSARELRDLLAFLQTLR